MHTSVFGQQQQAQSPFSQSNAFNQQSQPSPFQSNFNQPMTSYNSNFGQPQQQQPAFSNSPFASQQQQQQPQQSMFGTQQPFSSAQPYSSAPMSMYNQQPNMNTSPFATHTSMTTNQPSMFGSDPFNTSNYQQFPQQSQPQQAPSSSNNPFATANGGEQSFGVLQPQQIQPTPAPRGNVQQPSHLFSDLNPLPTSSSLRKDQFFNDVKNPPKPKLSELAPQKAQQTPPADNSKVSSLIDDLLTVNDSSANSNDYYHHSGSDSGNPRLYNHSQSCFLDSSNSQPSQQSTNPDLDWLNQLEGGSSTQSISTYSTAQQPSSNSQKQGLLPPPPSSLRQRQQQGPAPVVRPR